MAAENGELSDAELAELAAFADGSLPAEERERVSERVRSSPRLADLVAEQRASIAATSSFDVEAPPGLLGRVVERLPLAEEAPERSTGRRHARSRLAVGGLIAGVVALALAVSLLGESPTIGDAVELSGRGPSSAAPAVDRHHPDRLAASVSGVSFPNYEGAFGWRRSGERTDEVGGRFARTVFYAAREGEIAYSIVAGDPLTWPEGTEVAGRHGVELRSLTYDGAHVVTWHRGGHTCVLSSSTVGTRELLDLAAW